MQGTAADIIKRAMIAVDAWLRAAHRGARLIMQVHDELVLEVPEHSLDAVESGVREHMAARPRCVCRSRSTWVTGSNWDEAH